MLSKRTQVSMKYTVLKYSSNTLYTCTYTGCVVQTSFNHASSKYCRVQLPYTKHSAQSWGRHLKPGIPRQKYSNRECSSCTSRIPRILNFLEPNNPLFRDVAVTLADSFTRERDSEPRRDVSSAMMVEKNYS